MHQTVKSLVQPGYGLFYALEAFRGGQIRTTESELKMFLFRQGKEAVCGLLSPYVVRDHRGAGAGELE